MRNRIISNERAQVEANANIRELYRRYAAGLATIRETVGAIAALDLPTPIVGETDLNTGLRYTA